MIACAAGCTLRNRHLDDCEDPDTCRGCLPRPSADGSAVCLPCEGRWTHAISSSADLIAHIRSLIEPGQSGPSETQHKHTKGAHAPAPLNLSAISDADDLHACLASWAAKVAEESGMAGPDWSGTDVRPASRRRIFGEIAYTDARPVGLTSTGTATTKVAGWLLTHKEWALNRDWTADMIDEVCALTGKLRNRWPTEERPARLPVRCPGCSQRALTRYAPREPGWPVTITCDECRETIPESMYAWHAKRVTEEKRAEKAAQARAAARANNLEAAS